MRLYQDQNTTFNIFDYLDKKQVKLDRSGWRDARPDTARKPDLRKC